MKVFATPSNYRELPVMFPVTPVFGSGINVESAEGIFVNKINKMYLFYLRRCTRRHEDDVQGKLLDHMTTVLKRWKEAATYLHNN